MPNTTTTPTKPRNVGGRPRSTDPRTVRGIRMTVREFATYQALGGPDWFASAITRAKLTPDQRAHRDAIIGNAQQGLDLDTRTAPLVI